MLASYPRRDRRPTVAEPGAALGGVALLVVVVSALLSPAQDPRWPTECRIGGRTDWCAQPSAAMTSPAMRALVQSYCGQLSTTAESDVVPQPLRALKLAGNGVFATTTGSTGEGAEDALLGRADAFAWVTRAVGGVRDGQVEVRCPDVTARSPSVRLPLGQLRSTTAAMTDTTGMHLDFAKVAKRSVSAVSDSVLSDVSLGFTTCDTADMDLDDLSPGAMFSCTTEAYGQLGRSGYTASFRVVAEPPYFEPVEAG